MFNHAIMKAGLFLLVGAVMFRLGSVKIEDMAGIGRKMPITMAGFVVLGLSLLGAPGTVGFISKWYLALAALQEGQWWAVALIVAASLVTMLYIGRVVEVAYFREPTKNMDQLREAPSSMLIPAFVLVGAAVYFGLDTSLSVGLVQHVASSLINATY
jgi:multicomponent Na+:H+ antiporter subunit D